MLDSLVSLLAPHVCLQCGIEGSLWCDVCRATAKPVAERCYRCHRLSPHGKTCVSCRRQSPLFQVQAATRYEGYAKQLVWKLKFERAQAAAEPIASVLATRCALTGSVIITHAPTATSRVRRRGYDQARLIARRYAHTVAAPYQTVLLRVGQQQQRGQTRKQRQRQLATSFRVLKPEYVAGAHIVLVDDVITTGATLEAAARALRLAGAKRVSAVVFAQA